MKNEKLSLLTPLHSSSLSPLCYPSSRPFHHHQQCEQGQRRHPPPAPGLAHQPVQPFQAEPLHPTGARRVMPATKSNAPRPPAPRQPGSSSCVVESRCPVEDGRRPRTADPPAPRPDVAGSAASRPARANRRMYRRRADWDRDAPAPAAARAATPAAAPKKKTRHPCATARSHRR